LYRRALTATLVAAACAAPAAAQEDWRVQVTPYVWAPSIDGEIRPDGRLPTIDFELSDEAILEDLDAAFFLDVTARRGRLVLLADLTFANLSKDERWVIPRTRLTPEIDIEVDVDLKVSSSTLAAGYTVVQRPEIAVDLLGGVRLWSVELDVDVPNRIPRLPDRYSASETWADVILGGRLRYQFAPDWSVIAYADYGGFDWASETTWQAAATVNYRVSERWYLSAGYRALALDYDAGALDLDTTIAGPLFGVTARF
jgi:hypothetical protein